MSKKKTKKLTQVQVKEIERDMKIQFIADVYEIVLHSISRAATYSKQVVTIQSTHNRAARSVRFSIYGRHLAVLIHRDGNVELQFDESCHNEYSEQIFCYSPKADRQKKFLKQLDEMLEWLIPVFLEDVGPDFHTFMDYMDKSIDPTDAYEKMLTGWVPDVHQCEEVIEDETGDQ